METCEPNPSAPAGRRSLRRLFVAPGAGQQVAGDCVALSNDEQHYASSVLRLSADDSVILLDGRGQSAQATLVGTKKRCEAACLREAFAPAPSLAVWPRITLAMPLPKGDRADWLAEKMAELAVVHWVLLATQHSVTPARPSALARLERVMRSGARQARHGRVPTLEGPVPWDDFLARPKSGSRWLLDAAGCAAQELGRCGPDSTVLVGPEGGFAPEELRAALAQGYTSVSLGPHIMRMETAALLAAFSCGLGPA